MLKNSSACFADNFLTSGSIFFTAFSNGVVSVICEPMCICTPRSRRFFNFAARAYTPSICSNAMPNLSS